MKRISTISRQGKGFRSILDMLQMGETRRWLKLAGEMCRSDKSRQGYKREV
ncbi:unnamed protein product [Cuscuta epithymum]|uniref:Uncharacterized protein n=1 Tax=Cuscuta epithymum TaxID=186058 RepID=A0AAV0DZI1_9ASTE|nr:unnamed protein product [Cuscuta epithymum]